MTTHDFRPGDVVEWRDGCGNEGRGTVERLSQERVHLVGEPNDSHSAWRCTLVSRPAADPAPTPAEHPSRSHDFRPGDVVEWAFTNGNYEVIEARHHHVCLQGCTPDVVHWVRPNEVTFISRPKPTPPALHPSRERALLSLGAAREALEDAIDHLIKAGQPETVPGQREVRTRTAAEGAQQCVNHATMALYWLLHERLS